MLFYIGCVQIDIYWECFIPHCKGIEIDDTNVSTYDSRYKHICVIQRKAQWWRYKAP